MASPLRLLIFKNVNYAYNLFQKEKINLSSSSIDSKTDNIE